MSSDIITRLDEAYESLCDIGGAWERDVVADATAEIKRLRRWKAEATEVLARWNAVADLVPMRFGYQRSAAVAAEIQQLRALADQMARALAALRAERDAERALADHLAASLRDQGSPVSNFLADRALAAHKEARRG